MSKQTKAREYFGLMAEFEEADDLLQAVKQTSAAGYRQIDAYTPFPVHGMSEALGLDKQRNWLPYIVLLGAIAGGMGAYLLQYYASVISYPINVGGRPFHSWPSFMVITFEGAVLMAAVFGFLAMLALNKLPMHYHPVFNAPNFELATQEKFFLCVMGTDPKFDLKETKTFLASLHPNAVVEVEQGETEKIFD
jgi:hypothetical protein